MQHAHYWKYESLHAVVPTTHWETELMTNDCFDFLGGGVPAPCAANQIFTSMCRKWLYTFCFVILALYGSFLLPPPF